MLDVKHHPELTLKAGMTILPEVDKLITSLDGELASFHCLLEQFEGEFVAMKTQLSLISTQLPPVAKAVKTIIEAAQLQDITKEGLDGLQKIITTLDDDIWGVEKTTELSRVLGECIRIYPELERCAGLEQKFLEQIKSETPELLRRLEQSWQSESDRIKDEIQDVCGKIGDKITGNVALNGAVFKLANYFRDENDSDALAKLRALNEFLPILGTTAYFPKLSTLQSRLIECSPRESVLLGFERNNTLAQHNTTYEQANYRSTMGGYATAISICAFVLPIALAFIEKMAFKLENLTVGASLALGVVICAGMFLLSAVYGIYYANKAKEMGLIGLVPAANSKNTTPMLWPDSHGNAMQRAKPTAYRGPSSRFFPAPDTWPIKEKLIATFVEAANVEHKEKELPLIQKNVKELEQLGEELLRENSLGKMF